MGLNPEQAAHVKALRDAPDKVCGCGWFFKDECKLTCPSPAKSGPLETAYREGHRAGRIQERNRSVRIVESIRKNWGSSVPDSEGTRSGKMALDAALRDIKDSGHV